MDSEIMTAEEQRMNRLFVPWFRASMRKYPPDYKGFNRWLLPGMPRPRGARKRKKKKDTLPDGTRRRTRRGRAALLAEHRANQAARDKRTKRELGEVIASLSNAERKAIAADEHVISAVEKIVEAMLFRFS